MSYIPFVYDNLLQAVLIGIGALTAIGMIGYSLQHARPKAWLLRRLIGTTVAVLFALFGYALYVLMRQAHEAAEETRQSSYLRHPTPIFKQR